MPSILRRWNSVAEIPTWYIWDRGDELWELKGGVLSHYALISREKIDSKITEHLQLLPESPIPLEAIRHSIQGWEVVDVLLEEDPLSSAVLSAVPQKAKKDPSAHSPPQSSPSPLTQALSPPKVDQKPQSHFAAYKRTMQVSSGLLQESSPSDEATTVATHSSSSSREKKTPRAKPSQPPATEEEESLQHPYTHSMELWSSLSQWIPQNALFQPSLHHQAFSELSDIPTPSCQNQKYYGKKTSAAQVQSQDAPPSRDSRPYYSKPSYQKKAVPTGPLFI